MKRIQPTSDQPAPLPAETSRRIRERLVWWMVLFATCFALSGGCIWLIHHARQRAIETSCRNSLKLIWLALENHADTYGGYPPVTTLDERGRTIQSWRARLMPFLGRYSFEKEYDLSKPWDSPANRTWTD